VLFVGVDWAEDHHDVCVMAEDGEVLGKRRVPDSVTGIGDLHGLVAQHSDDDEAVVVGNTDAIRYQLRAGTSILHALERAVVSCSCHRHVAPRPSAPQGARRTSRETGRLVTFLKVPTPSSQAR
jgi:hypothetical protein